MKTMRIYRITVDQAFRADECGTHFSLEPWGQNTDYYKGTDDSGELYGVPEGYSLGKDAAGELHLYDPKDLQCDIVGTEHPAIHDSAGNIRRLNGTVR